LTSFQQFVEQAGRPISLAKGDHLFLQGDVDSSAYLVSTGMLKAYYLREDGREHIKSFLPEGSVIGSMVAMLDGEACTFSLVAIEDSEVIALPYRQLAEAAQGDLALANSLVGFLAAYGRRKERREFELLSMSAEDRYANLLAEMPHVAERVSQADLASYTGITPQALSRIKRRNKTR